MVAGGTGRVSAEPVPLIFDTDIGNDCDDVMAIGVIHALQSRGECELLAVTITKDNPLAAAFTDVLNTFYGRGDIPIGVCNSGVIWFREKTRRRPSRCCGKRSPLPRIRVS